eukprot:536481-Rhodomonas_salina.1
MQTSRSSANASRFIIKILAFLAVVAAALPFSSARELPASAMLRVTKTLQRDYPHLFTQKSSVTSTLHEPTASTTSSQEEFSVSESSDPNEYDTASSHQPARLSLRQPKPELSSQTM